MRVIMLSGSDLGLFLASPENVSKEVELVRYSNAPLRDLFEDTIDLIYLLTKCPDKSNLLITRILNSKEEFDRLIVKPRDLIYLAKKLPAAQADQLMQFILIHPDEFLRLIKTDKDFTRIKNQFSRYAQFFQEKTIVDVAQTLTANIETIRLAITFMIDELNLENSDSHWKNLSIDLLLKIASYTIDTKLYTEKSANNLAKDNWNDLSLK